MISITKYFTNFYGDKLRDILNDFLKENRFSNLLKIAKTCPVFKKPDNMSRKNYCSISTKSNFIKPFKSFPFSRVNGYMENKVSKYISGFRKHFNTLY